MSTWPPCAMLYDGSFAGFLTCVGESFRQKVYPFYFLSPGRSPCTPFWKLPPTRPWPSRSTAAWRKPSPPPSAG